jgi:hypothetical protein
MAITLSPRWGATVCLVMLATSALSAADLEQYRDFRLGSSTAAVAKAAGADLGRDLTTIHRQPALLQELRWRPPLDLDRGIGGDSVRSVVFSFIDDQLFTIVVGYERTRTEGLTKADMIAALSAVYGAGGPVSSSPRPSGGYALDAPTTLAQWRSSDTTVRLQHQDYNGEYALTVTSVVLEQRARKAQATAAATDVREAPARDAALRKSEAEAARERAAKTRSTNKETFDP